MTSPLFPRTEKEIRDLFDSLEREHVTPWAFFNSGKPFTITKFDGSIISSAGLEFSGSKRDIYWHGYIEPFIESITLKVIELTARLTDERDLDLRITLKEAEGSLIAYARKIYNRMAEIDQRLRGKGYPDSVPKFNTHSVESNMVSFIRTQTSSELMMYHPKSKFEIFYSRNPALVWLIGTLVVVFGAIASLVLGKGPD